LDASSSSERKIARRRLKEWRTRRYRSFDLRQRKNRDGKERKLNQRSLESPPSLPPSLPGSHLPHLNLLQHDIKSKKTVTNESTFPMYYMPQRKANATKTNPRRVAFLGTWASFSLVYLLWETINNTQPNARLINSFCCM